MFDAELFVADRMHKIDASGIRRVFDLAATLKNPINFSIGQPDFDVPETVKQAAINAITNGQNRYTVTQGTRELYNKVAGLIQGEFPLWAKEPFGTLITSGVSGGLLLSLLCCVQPGDEVLVPDPYFVMYKHLITLAGGTAVYVDTYPDFQTTAERLEKHITPRTKIILFNSPSNPTGVVATDQVCRDVIAMAERRNILVISDEIYDEFCYEKVERPAGSGIFKCPSPALYSNNLLVLRGFSKTYGMTGWRLGYAVGPIPIIEQMTKLQQYSFVCAPSMVQVAGVLALDLDMSPYVEKYKKKRDYLLSKLRPAYNVTTPGGAFYAFPEVPKHLGLTASQFVEKAVGKGLLVVPGSVFSNQDTHFRISYACTEETIDKGTDVLLELAK